MWKMDLANTTKGMKVVISKMFCMETEVWRSILEFRGWKVVTLVDRGC